jgi:ATP-binding cassette subfamily C protein
MILVVAVKLIVLAGTIGFAGTVAGLLGDFLNPGLTAEAFRGAIVQALLSAAVVLIGEILVGEAEYLCAARARTRLRGQSIARLLELDAAEAERLGATAAITRAVDGVESLQIYYSKYLPALLYSLIAPVGIFFVLREISLSIAVLLLVAAYIITPLNSLFRQSVEKAKTGYWNSFHGLTEYYLESLRALTTIKLFNRDEERTAALGEKTEEFNRNIMVMMKLNFVAFLFTDTLIYLAVAAAVVMAGVQAVGNAGALPGALMTFMLSYSFFSSVRQLMTATHQALAGVAASRQVAELLEPERPVPDRSKATDKTVSAYEGIEIRGLSYHYEGREDTLRNVDIRIPKGKVTALVGQSGCGKSTLASLMVRLLDPSDGVIALDGVEYSDYALEELRGQVVLVPQSVGVFSGAVEDNLRIAAPHADEGALWSALEDVRLKEWALAQKDGLQTEVGDAGAKLSGGQRQKIGIARALLSGAPYLIFDEATSSVDPESEREIWACISELSATRTVIIISHRLSTIRQADRVYVMADGSVAEHGTHDELMARHGIYRQMVVEQSELERYGERGSVDE